MTTFNLTLAKTLFPNKVSHSFGGNGSSHRAHPSHTDSEESEWLGSGTIPSWPGLGEGDSQHSWGLPGCPTCPHRCRFPMSPLQGAANPRSARCPWTKPRQNAELWCWAQAGLGPGEGSSASLPQPRTQTPGRMGHKSENSWRREINTFACWMAEGLNLVLRALWHFPGTCTEPTAVATPTSPLAGSQAPRGWLSGECFPTPSTHFPERCGDLPEVTQPSVRACGGGAGALPPILPVGDSQPSCTRRRPSGALRTGEAGVALIRAPQWPSGSKAHPRTPVLPVSRRTLQATGLSQGLPSRPLGGPVTSRSLSFQSRDGIASSMSSGFPPGSTCTRQVPETGGVSDFYQLDSVSTDSPA